MASTESSIEGHRWAVVGVAVVLIAMSIAGCGTEDVAVQGAASAVPTAGPQLDPNPPLTIGAGQGRPAEVVLPSDYDVGRRYPLVILLHGFSADANLQDFVFHLRVRTTRYQFILALPNGTRNAQGVRFWDATPECCNFGGPPVDDVGYLASLMREAMELYAVDPGRIRLVGHSNGGYMSYRFACEQPVRIDRIAVLAGSTSLDAASCTSPQPVSVVHTHGTRDDTVPYERNLPPDGDPSMLSTVGAEAALARWAGIAGCTGEAAFIERRDHHTRLAFDGDPAETEVFRYAGCAGGRILELWRGNGADHLYLSANDTWRDDLAAFLSE